MKESKKSEIREASMAAVTSSEQSQVEPVRRGTLLVVTGPSGVGKGTIVSGVLANVDQLAKSVSVTTRQKRPDETEGVDYFFRSETEFFAMRDRDEFLEWAEFAGSHYGTPRQWVQNQMEAGVDVILEIEVQGAQQIRAKCDDAVLIFISPPSFQALEKRLRSRATETPEKIAIRLKKAQEEMKQRDWFKYEVINDILAEAIRNLEAIVYAERLRIEEEPR